MKDGYNPLRSTERTIHAHGDGIEGGGECLEGVDILETAGEG